MPMLIEQLLGAGSNGTVRATGGANMNLNPTLVLCQRADDDPYRGFDGRYPSLAVSSTPSSVSCPDLAFEPTVPSVVYFPESRARELVSPCLHRSGNLLFTPYFLVQLPA